MTKTQEQKILPKKLVIVGDGFCGKTSLLMAYRDGAFPDIYVPTVFDDYSAQATVDGKRILLHLWDTAGQEEYDRLRPLAYPDSDVVLICFTVESRASYNNIRQLWLPEVLHYCYGIPFFLVACKKDLRNDLQTRKQLARNNDQPISNEEGNNLSKAIGAHEYVECSAKTLENVNYLFQQAAAAAVRRKAVSAEITEGGCCTIL